MKQFLTVLITALSLSTWAQKNYQSAQVNTTINIIAPEEDGVENIAQEPRGGGMNFRNMMDGETKSVTMIKGDLIKTTLKSDIGRTTVYRDNARQLTTMVMEMMGNKSGFFATDEDQANMQKRRDSMMAERRKADTGFSRRTPPQDRTTAPAELSVTSEMRKIAGFNCLKAYLISTRFMGNKDTATVWYTDEIKVNNLKFTGGMSNLPGMGNMMPSLNGVDKIDGFVMRYEIKMRRNRRMEVEVTKIEPGKEIDNSEFEIPKGIDIKPMSEMQNMFRGGFRGSGRD